MGENDITLGDVDSKVQYVVEEEIVKKPALQTCTRCVMDTSAPGIVFDEDGVCDYCSAWDMTAHNNPNDERGAKRLGRIVDEIKRAGKGKPYDCIVGVSGGTDSTYLLHWAKKTGLRPLAVQVDNGWNTEISVRNIRNATSLLGIDLYTEVLDWEEFKTLQVAFLKSSTPDADSPTDMAIRSVLYRVASREGIKYFLVGNNFRAEGKVPIFWSYRDGRYVKDISEHFGRGKFRSYPNFTIWSWFYFGLVKRIKQVRPYWYMKFDKEKTKVFLKKELGWEYYGGHHYENIYTRFLHGYYLVKKFGYDKRKVEFSALVRSGELTRKDALRKLAEVQYPLNLVKSDIEYVKKKLNLTTQEFEVIMTAPPRQFTEFRSYFSLLRKYRKLFIFGFTLLYPSPPQIFYYMKEEHQRT